MFVAHSVLYLLHQITAMTKAQRIMEPMFSLATRDSREAKVWLR